MHVFRCAKLHKDGTTQRILHARGEEGDWGVLRWADDAYSVRGQLFFPRGIAGGRHGLVENHISFGNEGAENDELLPQLTHGFRGTDGGNIPPKGTEITAQIARRTTTGLSRTPVDITKKALFRKHKKRAHQAFWGFKKHKKRTPPGAILGIFGDPKNMHQFRQHRNSMKF